MSTYGYLAHYGVQGMKWGVRNYQNADGSLTAAGRQRYNIDGNLVNEKGSSIGVTRFKRIGKNSYLQYHKGRLPDLNEDKTGKYDSNGKLKYKTRITGVKKVNKSDVASFYNLQRSATLDMIKKDAKQSIKEGTRTRSQAKSDYKSAKRDVDRIMSKHYGKTISSFAKQQRIADKATIAASVAFLAALPVAYVAANQLEKRL